VRIEEESFRRTLSRGLKRLEAALTDLAPGERAFPPPVAADLYDTYGFPVDLTGIICKEKGLTLDEPAVEAAVRQRQGQDGDGHGSLGSDKAIGDLYFKLKERLAGQASFTGYDEHAEATSSCSPSPSTAARSARPRRATGRVHHRPHPLLRRERRPGRRHRPRRGRRPLSSRSTTPKSPPATSTSTAARSSAAALRVGQIITLIVDPERRAAIRRNHSATHLLHHALRTVLGTHVAQKGSLVGPDRLRFDFSHTRPLTLEQRRRSNAASTPRSCATRDSQTRNLSMAQARETGAIGLFEAKYGEVVRVINIGGESIELCGGTHVARAGDIGLFAIVSETGIAQGVRRIEAVTGMNALAYLQQTAQIVGDAAGQLHAAGPHEVLPSSSASTSSCAPATRRSPSSSAS
jgi:alanyl-tRNA synthetase